MTENGDVTNLTPTAKPKGTWENGGISLVFMPGGRHEKLDYVRGAVS